MTAYCLPKLVDESVTGVLMLAELAAANAAFAVIKTAVQNGRDIASAGTAIAQFVGAKRDTTEKNPKEGRRL